MSAWSGSSVPEVSWVGSVSPRRRSAAIGTFDGVHLGHRQVIAGADTVITFSPHPRAVVGQAPQLLQDLERKIEVLGGLGVAEIVLIPFDRELAATSPTDFVDRILVEALGVERLAVGSNFHFGSRGAGGVADLLADPRFETRVEPLFVREGGVISSTRIRELIAAGKIEDASRLLGDALQFRCLVGPGEPGESLSLRWPTGLVRPAPGTYDATVLGPDGTAVRARLRIADAGDRIISSTGPIGYGAAVVSLVREVGVAPRELAGSLT
jgi:riboflavin kinase/FMN adenylyltransferase